MCLLSDARCIVLDYKVLLMTIQTMSIVMEAKNFRIHFSELENLMQENKKLHRKRVRLRSVE